MVRTCEADMLGIIDDGFVKRATVLVLLLADARDATDDEPGTPSGRETAKPASRYTSPWSSIAFATLRNPPMLAPLT